MPAYELYEHISSAEPVAHRRAYACAGIILDISERSVSEEDGARLPGPSITSINRSLAPRALTRDSKMEIQEI